MKEQTLRHIIQQKDADMLSKAKLCVARYGMSTQALQRNLKIGYGWASQLLKTIAESEQ